MRLHSADQKSIHRTSTPQPHRADHGDQRRNNRTLKSAIWMVALIVGFYLVREHWDHVAGNWVYLLLLACPLMHLFHGHGGHQVTVTAIKITAITRITTPPASPRKGA